MERKSFYLSYRVKALGTTVFWLLAVILSAILFRVVLRGGSVLLPIAALTVLLLGGLAVRRWVWVPFQEREQVLRVMMEGGAGGQEVCGPDLRPVPGGRADVPANAADAGPRPPV